MKYLAGLALALLPCCGTAPSSRPVVTHEQPTFTLQLHGDTDFTYPERAVIAQAVGALEYQTAGLYRIGIVYDLDFQAGGDLKFQGYPWLVRVESTYQWIQVIEEMHGGGHILGLTLVEPGKAPLVHLVADRLGAPGMLKHVAMHELLHAVGLDDLGPPGSVMSGSACGGVFPCTPVLCLTPADAAEFCRVAHCREDELNGCGWGG